jgi:hypothetical protein
MKPIQKWISLGCLGIMVLVCATARADKHSVMFDVNSWWTKGGWANMNITISDSQGTAYDNSGKWAIRCLGCGVLEKGTYQGVLDGDNLQVEAKDMKGNLHTRHYKIFAHEWVKPIQ